MLVVLCSLLVLFGLTGIIVPILPGGSLLVGAAVLLWAWAGDAGSTGWVVFALAAVILAAAAVAKYAVPGRGLKAAGIPLSTQLAGGILGVVGFFVVPVIGLVLGFLLGVYLAEVRRLGPGSAGRSARLALKAAATSILIDLAGALLATGVWIAGVVLA